MLTRSDVSRENYSLRFALVSICAASLLLFGVPAPAQRQVLQTRIAAPPKVQPGCARACSHVAQRLRPDWMQPITRVMGIGFASSR